MNSFIYTSLLDINLILFIYWFHQYVDLSSNHMWYVDFINVIDDILRGTDMP